MQHPAYSRRQFLRRSLITAAAAPYILPTLARGQAAPSNRVTLGVIGTGLMGNSHLDDIVNYPEVQIVAVCDVHRGRREAARQKVEEAYAERTARGDFKGVDAYNEYERVLERADIDAVLIAAPDHWHAILAIAACRAGKDVYCEKPLSLTVREAWEMVRAARRYGRVFQTGSQQRSSGEFRKACSLVRAGRIGRVLKVNVGIGKPSAEGYFPEQPVPEGFDWDRWLGPAPWQPYNEERCRGVWSTEGWRGVRDYSGGMMTDWGAHHFDIAQWGLGMDGSGPVEIIPPGVAAEKSLTYRYANGVLMYHGGANGVRFTGTEGVVEVNRGHFRTDPARIGEEPLRPDEVLQPVSDNHFAHWLECLRTRRRPIADVEIGASSVTVCHLGNIAWWLGRPLRWDPQARAIVDDAGAAAWLDRPKRAPYRI